MEKLQTIRFVESGNTPPETQKPKSMEQESNRVWSKVETITPQIAQEYLAMNERNRPIRNSRVIMYADAMLRGQWQLNGEAICFDVKRTYGEWAT